MRQPKLLLLTFLLCSLCFTPPPAMARDIGQFKETTKEKKTAWISPVTVELVALTAVPELRFTGLVPLAAPVANTGSLLTKTTTVESKAIATVAGDSYRRSCYTCNGNDLVSNPQILHNYHSLHIDPGLLI